MRLTTVIWLGIFMRREASRGAYVAVLKKGAQQAGAPFVIHLKNDGFADVYGPAPQALIDSEEGERQFERVLHYVDKDKVDEYLARQEKFDPDLWIIETESGSGDISLLTVS